MAARELAARLATGKPDFMVQVAHQRKYPVPAEAEPGYLGLAVIMDTIYDDNQDDVTVL